MTPRIRDALIRLDPAHRAEYERNHTRLDGDLERLDLDVREQLSPIKRRDFLVFHPSWGYLADAKADSDRNRGQGARAADAHQEPQHL